MSSQNNPFMWSLALTAVLLGYGAGAIPRPSSYKISRSAWANLPEDSFGLPCPEVNRVKDVPFPTFPPLTPKQLENVLVSELIERLQQERYTRPVGADGWERGTGTGFWVDDFIATPAGPESRHTDFDKLPVVRELVRRGVAALPELLAHLDDRRQTRLFESAYCVDYVQYYCPRYADPARQPSGLAERNKRSPQSFQCGAGKRKQAILIGDLCFTIIGQIVNRPFSVLVPAGSCWYTFSPLSPELIAVVRQDWQGLTLEEHKQALRQEANGMELLCDGKRNRKIAALKRLAFYYPEEAQLFSKRRK